MKQNATGSLTDLYRHGLIHLWRSIGAYVQEVLRCKREDREDWRKRCDMVWTLWPIHLLRLPGVQLRERIVTDGTFGMCLEIAKPANTGPLTT